MAYENMTYEVILERMISRVTANYPDLDYSEGSIIQNALAPAALELAIAYTELDNVLRESFVETASREYKLIGCQDKGMDISLFEARAGVFKGEFNVEVELGSRWNCDLFNYTVTEFLGKNGEYFTYSMLCDTSGTTPNNMRGTLISITDEPDGLEYAELTECLIEGENESSDDEINKAYANYVNNAIGDGNVNQYLNWCDEYDGIGNARVFPLWNGANTVKVSILSASNRAASEELVNAFQTYIDPGVKGMGDGKAPIGAFVTITTAVEVPISVKADITMENGYSDTSAIATALEEYFESIAYKKNTVSYMNIGAAILNATGVESVSNLRVNNAMIDITLGEEEIPVLSSVDWAVI